jgi:hypothetical protein
MTEILVLIDAMVSLAGTTNGQADGWVAAVITLSSIAQADPQSLAHLTSPPLHPA